MIAKMIADKVLQDHGLINEDYIMNEDELKNYINEIHYQNEILKEDNRNLKTTIASLTSQMAEINKFASKPDDKDVWLSTVTSILQSGHQNMDEIYSIADLVTEKFNNRFNQ